MDIRIRFRHPEWIFMDPIDELDESLLEELDLGEDDLEELNLLDDGGFDKREGVAVGP